MKISPWATGAMKVAVFSAAFAIPGTGMAMAAGPIQSTSGNGSILGGNQINLPINAPIDVCGNAVAVLGNALAGCKGGASVHTGGGRGPSVIQHTSGNGSILGGNQVNVPVNAPIDVCGNAAALRVCDVGKRADGRFAVEAGSLFSYEKLYNSYSA